MPSSSTPCTPGSAGQRRTDRIFTLNHIEVGGIDRRGEEPHPTSSAAGSGASVSSQRSTSAGTPCAWKTMALTFKFMRL